ncbi:HNH endonuclease [Exiguobacterium sp. s152]|uniref:HNH endonuclease n=1 Tax=Exiguobacterium sp. s152 TaxID=2751226 RepID=UPI001BE84147|nr:HNH endonuclease [Exiguobacterium sp. s152]
MIKLEKLPEPEILTQKYQVWTDELIKRQESDDKVPDYVKSRYTHSKIKDFLIKETFGKCAYCEKKILSTSFGDIEHIIPKVTDSYGWFKWSNLTLACQKCNNAKSNHYDRETRLLDPYLDDIDKHLTFLGPTLFGVSQRGTLTMKTIKLNRVELMEDRTRYLKQTIQPFLDLINVSEDPDLKHEFLNDLLELAEQSEEFSSMTRHAIQNLNLLKTI